MKPLSYVGLFGNWYGLDFDILGTDAGKRFTRKMSSFRRAHYLIRGWYFVPS